MSLDSLEHDFKRFIFTAFSCFVVIFISVWLWVALEPMVCLSVNYPFNLAKQRLAAGGGSVVVLGDSVPEADIVPKHIGPTVLDLGLGGGSSIETFYFARKVVGAPSPPKAVIISISPYHFTNGNAPYANVGPDELEEVRRTSRLLNDNVPFGARSPGDLDTRLKNFLYGIDFPSLHFQELIQSYLFQNYRSNQMAFEQTILSRGHVRIPITTDRTTTPDLNVGLKSFVPSKTLDYYFNRTLELLHSRDIPVYFIFMPCNEASTQLYWPGLKAAFVDYLNHYASLYPNFHILGDPLPTYPSEDFSDETHLNEKAAEKWSDHVAQLLNDSHVEGGPFGSK